MTNDEISKKFEHIKKEFHTLGGQLSDLASISSERLEGYRDEAMNEIREVASDTSKEVQHHMKIADEYAHKNPWAVVAGFSVVGLILGLIFSNNKSKK